MQQFTRSLTREVEVGGERLAVTLGKEGISVRPVGGRRPPHNMTWEAWLCACVAGGGEPSSERIQEAIKAVKAGGPKEADNPAPAAKQAASEPAPAAPAAAPAGGADLKELLGRVDHWLSAHRQRFQKALQPGASSADLDTLSAAVGKPVPEDLRTWLLWHNGQSADVPGAFEGSWNLMSAQEMADAKKELDTQPHDGWQKDWLPFLEDDNGNYLCLDLSSPDLPVRECWRGRADHAVVTPSLKAWVSDFVAGLERGAYAEDPERGTLARR